MAPRLLEFADELRSEGVAIGTSELLDAFQALAEVSWTELCSEPADLPSFKRNVAQAHEELANLPGAAGEQFKAVSRCLAESNKANKPPE